MFTQWSVIVYFFTLSFHVYCPRVLTSLWNSSQEPPAILIAFRAIMWHKYIDEYEDWQCYKKLTSVVWTGLEPMVMWTKIHKHRSVLVVHMWKPSQGRLLAYFYHVWIYLRGTLVAYRYTWRSNICRNHVEDKRAVLRSGRTWQFNDLENVARGTWFSWDQVLIANCSDFTNCQLL
jgi:hypothetical protein